METQIKDSKIQKNMVKYHIQYERLNLKIWVFTPVGMGYFFLFIMKDWKGILLLSIGAVFLWLLLKWLCVSMFSIKHSHIGKELMRYGELKSMVKDVNEQAREAWYCTGDQALTEKYIMLVERNKDYRTGTHLFLNESIFRLVSTSELERVEVEKDNLYPEERNILIFWTLNKEQYQFTIYRNYQEVCKMKNRIEADSKLRKGPMPKKQSNINTKKILKKKERPFSPSSGYTMLGCYKKKKKIVIRIVLAVFCVLVIVMAWMVWELGYTWKQLLWDIRRYPIMFLFVAALYIVPYSAFYMFVCYMERQVKKKYQRLAYHEQQSLDKRIQDAPEIWIGEVLYAENCFWFRDFRRLCMQNLVFYQDVVWAYVAYGVYQNNLSEVPTPNVLMTKIVFYTKDGKQHSILHGNWKMFSSMLPANAIRGYGKEQERAYKAYIRDRKIRKS